MSDKREKSARACNIHAEFDSDDIDIYIREIIKADFSCLFRLFCGGGKYLHGGALGVSF